MKKLNAFLNGLMAAILYASLCCGFYVLCAVLAKMR